MLYDNLGINDQGHLTIGGLDAVGLAEEFGAPLYVLDEDQVPGQLPDLCDRLGRVHARRFHAPVRRKGSVL